MDASAAFGLGPAARWLGALLAALAAVLIVAAPAGAEEASELDELGRLQLEVSELVPAAPAEPANLDALGVDTKGVRVAVISSGVDTSVFPEELRNRISVVGESGDDVGYGTYASSILLQLLPEAQITSLNVYPDGRFHSTWHEWIVAWLADNAGSFDVVLHGLPPSDFLDPTSAAMAAGEWERVADAIDDRPFSGAAGPAFGLPIDGGMLNTLKRPLAQWEGAAVDRFRNRALQWLYAMLRFRSLADAGVAVVSPAGDLGPGPQTAFGVANLPEVVTVGGFDGDGISPTSGSGPSIDGHVKPDLAAPTGTVGLVPPSSPLARYLDSEKLLDASLEPVWDAGAPLTDARTRLDSTLASAAVVAAAMGGLAAEGIRDVDRQRGALAAAAVPLDGVPVWRQGAGVMRDIPDAAAASSRPLILDHGSLGLEPSSGSWEKAVRLTEGKPGSASVRITDFIGVAPNGKPATRSVASGEGPPVSAVAREGGVDLSAPLGDPSEGGLYCGYTDVSVPLTDGEVDNVPTCLLHGTSLRAHGFYIHDLPAEDLTFGLLPALPPGASLLDHPLHMLPVNPLDTHLYFRVTGVDGNADFPNVAPGYYRVRQFSDYGTPIEQTRTDSRSGSEVTESSDIGQRAAYQSFDALILSAVCDEALGETAHDAGHGRPCSDQFLRDRFGDENVSYDKPTGGWWVDLAADKRIRVVFEWLKKMPGANVASRYIDLLDFDDFEYTSLEVAGASLRPKDLIEPTPAAGAWELARDGDDPAGIKATATSIVDDGAHVAARLASYPFNLTTPNYSAHMSLNFSYEITNAVLYVAVKAGNSWVWGVVWPRGTVQLPEVDGHRIDLSRYPAWGHAEGEANFELPLLPRGAREGTLYFAFVPQTSSIGSTRISSARVGDVSFALDTWTNALWPAATFAETGKQGHAFAFDSRYSRSQMSDPCREIDNGERAARVCEDWQVIVHSPGDDAATFDAVDLGTAGTPSLFDEMRDAGTSYYDPRRGSHTFHHVLSFGGSKIGSIELPENRFRTNGRFWEQLPFVEDVLAAHPGPIEVRIEDNVKGRDSALLPHRDGAVPVAPYVPFTGAANQAFLKLDGP